VASADKPATIRNVAALKLRFRKELIEPVEVTAQTFQRRQASIEQYLAACIVEPVAIHDLRSKGLLAFEVVAHDRQSALTPLGKSAPPKLDELRSGYALAPSVQPRRILILIDAAVSP
jgi:hypothetical protein